jgi:hypothetical protein
MAEFDGWQEIDGIKGKTKRGAPRYLQAQGMPKEGRFVVVCGRHAFALIDGRVRDTGPIKRTRAVPCYFRRPA